MINECQTVLIGRSISIRHWGCERKLCVSAERRNWREHTLKMHHIFCRERRSQRQRETNKMMDKSLIFQLFVCEEWFYWVRGKKKEDKENSSKQRKVIIFTSWCKRKSVLSTQPQRWFIWFQYEGIGRDDAINMGGKTTQFQNKYDLLAGID